jgi:membrane protease YdiL (CAAX protease family)
MTELGNDSNADTRPNIVKSRLSAANIISLTLVWLVAVWTLTGAFVLFNAGDSFEGWVGLVALLFFLFFQIVLPKLAGMSNPVVMRNIISFIMVSSLTVGRYFYLYSRLEYFDKSQHVLYGMVIVLIGLLFFYRLIPVDQRENPNISPVILWFWLTGFAMLALLLWEVFEYFGDRLTGSDMQSWKAGPISGLTDTIIDLITGFAGAALMASLIAATFRRGRRQFYRRWLAGCFSSSAAPSGDCAEAGAVSGGTVVSASENEKWQLSPALYIIYIISALSLYALASRVWQPTYMIRSSVKIILFAVIPVFVSRYYTFDLNWLKLRFYDRRVKTACLKMAAAGILLIALMAVLSEPLGTFFGVEEIMAEIQTRTKTPELMVWFALIYIPVFNASVEEIFFRGFVFRSLADKINIKAAYALSALLFAVYHLIVFRNWFNLPLLLLALSALMAAGLFLNWLVSKYDSLLPAWIIHGLLNIAIFTVAVPFI